MKKAISAGGVITKLIDGKVRVLFIRDPQYDDWFLPKGHVEKGETIQDGAKREIMEEAGLSNITFICHLHKCERYVESHDEMKTIHYYLVTVSGEEESKETPDNKNFIIKWFDIDDLPPVYLKEQEEAIKNNIALIKSKIK